MADLLGQLLLLQLLLAPAMSFNISVGSVLEKSSDSQIVSDEYWAKFHDFVALLDGADPENRTVLLTRPHIQEFVVPPELLEAIADNLTNATWLSGLGAEYQRRGGYDMRPLMEALAHLGAVKAREQVALPLDVLKKLCWRALVRHNQQQKLRRWVISAVDAFFNNAEAKSLQRADFSLFDDYMYNVFENNWMPVDQILMDTLEHHKLRAELAAEVVKAHRAEQPPELPDWRRNDDQRPAPAGDQRGDQRPAAGEDQHDDPRPAAGEDQHGDQRPAASHQGDQLRVTNKEQRGDQRPAAGEDQHDDQRPAAGEDQHGDQRPAAGHQGDQLPVTSREQQGGQRPAADESHQVAQRPAAGEDQQDAEPATEDEPPPAAAAGQEQQRQPDAASEPVDSEAGESRSSEEESRSSEEAAEEDAEEDAGQEWRPPQDRSREDGDEEEVISETTDENTEGEEMKREEREEREVKAQKEAHKAEQGHIVEESDESALRGRGERR